MTPKEKAIELVNAMGISILYLTNYTGGDDIPVYTNQYAKQCALVAVEEILKSQPRYPSDVDWDDVGGTHQYYYEAQREEADKFWKEVEAEIEKLK